ncbi:MAG TPA: hypothetical protein VFU22_08495, partial [Roseiflexaceae bacterium]|nr:hypothetical protein [Roseiflexaceae bacterium]
MAGFAAHVAHERGFRGGKPPRTPPPRNTFNHRILRGQMKGATAMSNANWISVAQLADFETTDRKVVNAG